MVDYAVLPEPTEEEVEQEELPRTEARGGGKEVPPQAQTVEKGGKARGRGAGTGAARGGKAKVGRARAAAQGKAKAARSN